MLMVDIDVSLEVDNILREQVELAWRFWRRAKGEQEPGGRLARRLRGGLGLLVGSRPARHSHDGFMK